MPTTSPWQPAGPAGAVVLLAGAPVGGVVDYGAGWSWWAQFGGEGASAFGPKMTEASAREAVRAWLGERGVAIAGEFVGAQA